MTSIKARGAKYSAFAELLLFFGVVYAITWAICGVYLWAPKAAMAAFGPMKTGSAIFFLAVYAPSITSIVLTVVFGGWSGLLRLGASAVRIAGRWWWILLALIGYPLLWLLFSVIAAVVTRQGLASVPYDHWYAALPLVIASGFIFRDAGPLGEELGWRGFALPRLLAITDPRRAAIFLGAIWALWHLPAFFLSGLSQSKFQFGLFFFVVVGFSIFMTLLFIHTRGSVLLSGILPHMWFNAVSKAGIHPVDWIVIVLGIVLIVFGGRLWRSDNIEVIASFHNKKTGATLNAV
jgi:membrane protease YdiL (CAAX protease family)